MYIFETLLTNQNPAAGNPFISLLPIIIMFGALYLLFILPQQRADKKMKKMLLELKKGDKVITQSGIIGTVSLIKEDIVIMEIAPKVEISILKSSITRIIENKTDIKANE